MVNNNDASPDTERAQEIRQHLLQETARIPWHELQRFFAQGIIIEVAEGLDLIETAVQLTLDNAGDLASWIASGQLSKLSDQRALDWYDNDALVWSVVLPPWILVQGLRPADGSSNKR